MSSEPQVPINHPDNDGDEVFHDRTSKVAFDDDARIATLEAAILTRTRWRGPWVAGTYEDKDQVEDDAWLMIANKQTTDRAAPQPSGNITWVSDLYGTLNFTEPTIPENVWVTGNEFTIQVPIRISSYRWWCPDNSGTFTYELWALHEGKEIQKVMGPLTPATTGWQEFPIYLFFPEDTVVSLILVARATAQPNVFSATWDIKNKNGTPGDGEAWFQNNATEIRIHHTDDGDNNQQTNLEAIPVGASIEFGGYSWTVTVTDHQASHVRFTVYPNQGRPSEDTRLITWTWGATDPIPYANHVDFYSAAAGSVRGFSGTTYQGATFDQDAYGVDLLGDQYIMSSDWDFQAYSD